ncbi:MAG: RNA polymerase subunit sigma-70, partial [Myxococcales bacterium]|nr:RNA polymerase subunit sigma-70 [Myxococcales bacterium]
MTLESAATPSPEVLAVLVDNHRRFLSFLQGRVGSREEAEDILQAAMVKGIEKGDDIRDDTSVVAWFFRLLRSAL